MPALNISVQRSIGSAARTRQEKEIKYIQIVKEEIKLFL